MELDKRELLDIIQGLMSPGADVQQHSLTRLTRYLVKGESPCLFSRDAIGPIARCLFGHGTVVMEYAFVLQEATAYALGLYALHDGCRMEIVRAKAPAALVQLVLHADRPILQLNALTALANLAEGEAAADAIAAEPLAEVVSLSCCNLDPATSLDRVLQLLALLNRVFGFEKHRALVKGLSQDMLRLILRLATLGDGPVSAPALQLLCACVEQDGSRSTLIAAGSATVLLDVLTKPVPMKRRDSANALSSLTLTADGRDAVVNANGLATILDFLFAAVRVTASEPELDGAFHAARAGINLLSDEQILVRAVQNAAPGWSIAASCLLAHPQRRLNALGTVLLARVMNAYAGMEFICKTKMVLTRLLSVLTMDDGVERDEAPVSLVTGVVSLVERIARTDRGWPLDLGPLLMRGLHRVLQASQDLPARAVDVLLCCISNESLVDDMVAESMRDSVIPLTLCGDEASRVAASNVVSAMDAHDRDGPLPPLRVTSERYRTQTSPLDVAVGALLARQARSSVR